MSRQTSNALREQQRSEMTSIQRIADAHKIVTGLEDTLGGQGKRFRDLVFDYMNEQDHKIRVLNRRLKEVEARLSADI